MLSNSYLVETIMPFLNVTLSVFDNNVVFINDLNPLPYFLNSLAKPYLEALDDIIDEKEEEGELEENDDEEEEVQPDQEAIEQEEGQEEQDNDDEDVYRQFIEEEFSDNDTE